MRTPSLTTATAVASRADTRGYDVKGRWGRWAAGSLAGAALAAGCSFPPSPVRTVTVTDKSGAISGIPGTLAAGQYTFSLSNATGGLQLVRLTPGYTQAQLLSDVGAVFGPPSPGAKAAAERLYAQAHFVGGANGATRFSAYLIPGSYVAVDPTGPGGRPEAFTVTPRAVRQNFPAADVAFGGSMLMSGGHESFAWQVIGKLKASGGTLRFTTLNGDEPHFLVLAKVKPGRTALQCFSFQGNGANPNCDEVLSTGVLSTNETMTMPYTLKGPGTYAIACFVTTPETGQPHAMLGMIRVLPPVR